MAMEQQQQPDAELVNHDEDREEMTLEPQVLYNGPITKDMPNEIRMGFVKKVYSILTIQLLLTFAIAVPIALSDPKFVYSFAYMKTITRFVFLACVCSMICCQEVLRTYPWNYVFLGVFTVLKGILLGFYGALFTWQSLALAGVLTTIVFLGLTAYAWTTKTDFTGMGPYLFGFLLIMLVFSITISILYWGFGVQISGVVMLFDILGVLLFCGYIIYDTQKMIGEYGGHRFQFSVDDYCFAALNLYLDIINLFLFLLRLVGGRR